MRKVQILIVDDEEALRDVIEMILESEIDANFIKAENGKIAEEMIQTQSIIDIIISDFNMPIKNGADLFNFNKSFKNIPMILLSGSSLDEHKTLNDFLVSNKLNRFLNKPFDENILINAVKEISQTISLNS